MNQWNKVNQLVTAIVNDQSIGNPASVFPPSSLIELPGYGEKETLVQTSASLNLIAEDIEEFEMIDSKYEENLNVDDLDQQLMLYEKLEHKEEFLKTLENLVMILVQ